MSSTDELRLSAKEMLLLSRVFQSLKAPPDIDYEKLMTLGNYRNTRSAQETWRPLMKKLMGNNPNANTTTNPPAFRSPTLTKTPSKMKKRKRAQDSYADSDLDTATPTARTPRKRKAIQSYADTGNIDEEEEEEATPHVKEEEPDAVSELDGECESDY
ncbi:hypothetical protein LTR66_001207 [Elasticomyces elasticus]|nr:hypothetical protein LTR66_001207 [Elasticomyces elasticus]